MTFRYISAVALSVLCGCTSVAGLDGRGIGDNPLMSGGSFTSGGGLTVAYQLFDDPAGTVICGVWAQSRRQSVLTRDSARQVMATGAIDMDGTRVVQDLRFMREIAPQQDYAGQHGGCIRTDLRAGQGRVTLSLPRQEVVRARGLSSYTVVFRPDGPAAHKNGLSLQDFLRDQIQTANTAQ